MLWSTGSLLTTSSGPGRDDLNLGFEAAFEIVELRRLARLRPGLSLGHVDEVYDRALDGLVGANPDQRLLARASAGLHILGGDDLLRRHVAAIDDDPLNGPAAGNGSDFVCLRRDSCDRSGDDREQTGQNPELIFTATPLSDPLGNTATSKLEFDQFEMKSNQ